MKMEAGTDQKLNEDATLTRHVCRETHAHFGGY